MEVNKTKDADLMLLGNKELYNKLVNKNEKSIIMKNDFIKYKKEIKTKINELFTMYSDPSNNCLFINNYNNDDYKYLTSFNSFVNHYVENIKENNFKKEIQSELSIYNNKISNSLNDNSFNSDFSNININKDLFNKSQNKNKTLDEFIEKKNITIKQKILPKKRYQK
tara:strand:- start:10650 stop:11150 length:501 start_codon:yes stop_codon:yes gene_type:complete